MVAMFILTALFGSIVQILTIFLLRENIIKSIFWATPLILLHQYLFLFGYSKAPKFIVIWFITAGLTNGLAFVAGYWIWKENVSWINLFGIFCIMTGISLLKVSLP